MGDALSRLDTPSGGARPIEEDIPVVLVCLAANPGQPIIDHILDELGHRLTQAVFRTAQGTDGDCRRYRANLGTSKTGAFTENADGLIMRVAPMDGAEQIVVPALMRLLILRRDHNSLAAGHPGKSRMFGSMRRYYYWPAMAVDIADYVKGCTLCAQNRLKCQSRVTPMQQFPPDGPNELVALDILGPLPPTSAGNVYIAVLSDRFTKLSRAIALPDVDAITIVRVFVDHWVSAYGVPECLLTDNGSSLTSKFWTRAVGLLGVKPLRTAHYDPQTNGQGERFNRTLVNILKSNVADHTETWDSLLSMVTLAYNARPHRSTKIAPLEWVMPMGVGNLAQPPGRSKQYEQPRGRKTEMLHLSYLAKLSTMIPRLRKALDRTQARYKRNFDDRLTIRNTHIVSGDWVYIRHQAFSRNKNQRPIKGTFQVLYKDGLSVVLHTDQNIKRISLNDVTPAPGIALMPVSNTLPHYMTRARPVSGGPNGPAYAIEVIIGHAAPNDPDGCYILIQ